MQVKLVNILTYGPILSYENGVTIPLFKPAWGFGNLRTANWRTGNMRSNMRTRPLIGPDVTRVPRAVRKVPHRVHSSHCFVSRPNEPYFSIAESRCICIFMTTVFWQLFVSVGSMKISRRNPCSPFFSVS